MLDVCRRRAEAEGFASRCHFHEGYLDSLGVNDGHDAATCFLVPQFILERAERSALFRAISDRLLPGGILASSDLASEAGPDARAALLHTWLTMMAGAGIPPDAQARMREAYGRDVAIPPPEVIASIIEAGGFETPVQFFQAGLIHAWFCRRPSADAA
jgi:tRNA (cmo5U34)-methyltransferase